ncbi:RHS repeat-associated core domain-containing protein [Paenimyroides ummariense]|uniref:RHS repeat-associated core domain-containing protein n=1 Tax=Paenimyroides ummariense TaxID=913024 RepID=A0A1I5GTD3_9FLAO|nr:RHS repeat-associated core domain-containing protein [Paenimyroides ummariense]SFO39187.1 RHS repeat-associated core domain-containing protein [Paenimyroides ummariense]
MAFSYIKEYDDIANSCRNEEAEAYKFLNKEYEDSFALNVTETDYRHYDSALGRFNVLDPMAELALDFTPYRYGFNNPVYWEDSTGLFESYGAAQSWIDKWGLIGAEISYNEYKDVYEISNQGYSFYQRGEDIISSMYSLETGITVTTFKGGASAAGDIWSPEFGAGFISTVQPGSGRITPIGGGGDIFGLKEMFFGEVAKATDNPYTGIIVAAAFNKGKVSVSNRIKNISKSGGTQLNSKTLWKGKGKERIDVENPNPLQRPGQVHYQDNVGGKYIYDPSTGVFRDAPKKVNDLLKNPEFKRAVEKGLNYLGY